MENENDRKEFKGTQKTKQKKDSVILRGLEKNLKYLFSGFSK